MILSKNKMIWESAIAVEMVVGWNDLQVENLLNALDEAVEAVFTEHETYVEDEK